MSYITPIEFEPIPRIAPDGLDKVAAELAVQNSVAILPATTAELFGYDPSAQHAAHLAGALTRITEGSWLCDDPEERSETAEDRGFHGNPVPDGHTPDRVHFHKNHTGVIEVTFAVARPAYLEADCRTSLEKYLDSLLKKGKTDARFVDPDTFRRGEVGPGDATIFRLNGPDRAPHLHDFRTLEVPRTSSITRIVDRRKAMELAS